MNEAALLVEGDGNGEVLAVGDGLVVGDLGLVVGEDLSLAERVV